MKTIIIFFMLISVSSAADVKLAWDANSEPDIVGYRLLWSETVAIPFDNSVDVGNVLVGTVPDLVVGTTYYFAVTAYNATKESGYSHILDYTVPEARIVITVPARPKSVTIIFD